MKKLIFIFGMAIVGLPVLNAQASTAMDFTITDCNSTTHHLYTDYLDNEEVVIMEFFMTCFSCAATGQTLDPMFVGLAAEYPGQVNFFAIAYTNSYTCSTINNWRNTNTPNAFALDSGATQVSYYGGMGMPTVVVVGGSNHQVLYNSQFDGPPADTATIHTIIDNFFATMGTENINNIKFSAYPNPTDDILNLNLTVVNPSQTNIEMLDITGKVVKDVANEMLDAGEHNFAVQTIDLINGIYFIRIQSNGKTVQHKVSVNH